jgi:hypothetical protein
MNLLETSPPEEITNIEDHLEENHPMEDLVEKSILEKDQEEDPQENHLEEDHLVGMAHITSVEDRGPIFPRIKGMLRDPGPIQLTILESDRLEIITLTEN